MKYIVAVDYGSKFCGLAKTAADLSVRVALPWELVKTEELEKFLLEHAEETEYLLLGDSLKLSGEPNKLARDIENFAKRMRSLGFKVLTEDERLSTQAALAQKRYIKRKTKSRKEEKKERSDPQAAACILQSHIDKLK